MLREGEREHQSRGALKGVARLHPCKVLVKSGQQGELIERHISQNYNIPDLMSA